MKAQYHPLTDRELIERFLAGDNRAFDALARRYRGKVMASIYQTVHDRALAHDLYQDTLIKIVDLLQKGKYQDTGKFLQWHIRVARNLTIDYLRKDKRNKNFRTEVPVSKFENSFLTNETAEVECMRKENKVELRALIHQLPKKQKEVLLLRMYSELSYKEIAESTETSINTALGRMRYAMDNLRKMASSQQFYGLYALCLSYLCG